MGSMEIRQITTLFNNEVKNLYINHGGSAPCAEGGEVIARTRQGLFLTGNRCVMKRSAKHHVCLLLVLSMTRIRLLSSASLSVSFLLSSAEPCARDADHLWVIGAGMVNLVGACLVSPLHRDNFGSCGRPCSSS